MEDGGKAVRYECTRCGACCRWAGDVCIETDEIREISRFLDMDEQVFICLLYTSDAADEL